MVNNVQPFDAVVMLTWSDWYTEMRSNRYHFATRFSKISPVYFVQPSSSTTTLEICESGHENIYIIKVNANYSDDIFTLLKAFVGDRGVRKPLLWVYNANFYNLVSTWNTPFKVYHATEDYFCEDFNGSPELSSLVKKTIECCSNVVSVSSGVEESILKHCDGIKNSIVSTNGCDFYFWNHSSGKIRKKIIFYQGGVSKKIDFELLNYLVDSTESIDVEFWFCGAEFEPPQEWSEIKNKKNVKYFGCLSPEEVRDLAHQAKVGIIPFVQNDWIKKRSHPLKFFEYFAAGLDVVSVEIDSLNPYGHVAQFANQKEVFLSKVRVALESHDESKVEKLNLARENDYDVKFRNILDWLDGLVKVKTHSYESEQKKILILYDPHSIKVKTIQEHLLSFKKYSMFSVFYAPGTQPFTTDLTLEMFDAVIVHYSIRISVKSHFKNDIALKLKAFQGLKILFIQDEYDNIPNSQGMMTFVNFDIVFTCVPDQYIEEVYPSALFKNVTFVQNLTGYVSEELEKLKVDRDISKRSTDIVYRGRTLPYWYGALGYEKYFIGKEFKSRLGVNSHGLSSDIELDDGKRIYGVQWWDFLSSGKTTLGTESGSNFFDMTGDVINQIKEYQLKYPNCEFKEVYELFLKGKEDRVRMNQVSPKIFESIALGTALILFEGEYSGVVEPNKHFVPLKKDFSNFDEVVDKLKDHTFLQEMAERAYKDVIISKRYNYQSFIKLFDLVVGERIDSLGIISLDGVPEELTLFSANATECSKVFLTPQQDCFFINATREEDSNYKLDSLLGEFGKARSTQFYGLLNLEKNGGEYMARDVEYPLYGLKWHLKTLIIEIASFVASVVFRGKRLRVKKLLYKRMIGI